MDVFSLWLGTVCVCIIFSETLRETSIKEFIHEWIEYQSDKVLAQWVCVPKDLKTHFVQFIGADGFLKVLQFAYNRIFLEHRFSLEVDDKNSWMQN